MKKLILAGVAALMSFGVVSAQIIETQSNQISYRNVVKEEKPVVERGYNRMALSYNNLHYSSNEEMFGGTESLNAAGVGFEYMHGFKLPTSFLSYIETGLKLAINQGEKYDDYDYETKMFNVSFSVPVNYVFRYRVSKKFSVLPYTGLNFKINAVQEMDQDIYRDGYYEFDMFDDDDMDGDTYSRFQIGWNIGAAMQFRKFYLGLGYTVDMNKGWSTDEYDKMHISTGNFNITMGLQW